MDHIPILRIENILLVSIQVEVHDRLALTLQDDLITRIAETGARGVILDISAVETVDSFIGRVLANMAAMARVLDANTVLVGMRPEVAITIVELGMASILREVRTAVNVDRGLQMLRGVLASQLVLTEDEDIDDAENAFYR